MEGKVAYSAPSDIMYLSLQSFCAISNEFLCTVPTAGFIRQVRCKLPWVLGI